ncbi:MAG: crossover junction endodeoxyribonuclease RuvC [Bacteroidetes bacterium]|nr:MAG: crossover junction endodeoxyribonuclease RuvC [Bacteroidota bacterium]
MCFVTCKGCYTNNLSNILTLGNLAQIKNYEKIILGIDPGTVVMGYGLIGIEKKQAYLIGLGIVKLDKLDDHSIRLKRIFERTTALIDQYKPDDLAIEAPFFGKNVQAMLKLGRAQGVAIAAAITRELVVNEYSPKKIKQSITGNGNASKEQVAAMLQQMLKFKETPEFLDATDGLAAAYCHYLQGSKPTSSGKQFNTWKAFAAANPKKIISGNSK